MIRDDRAQQCPGFAEAENSVGEAIGDEDVGGVERGRGGGPRQRGPQASERAAGSSLLATALAAGSPCAGCFLGRSVVPINLAGLPLYGMARPWPGKRGGWPEIDAIRGVAGALASDAAKCVWRRAGREWADHLAVRGDYAGLRLDELVENAVDELRAVGRAVAFGQLDGLVDRHAIGRVGVADFVGPQAEQVAVGGGHAVDRPVDGLVREQLVELCLSCALRRARVVWRTRARLRPARCAARNTPRFSSEFCGFRSSWNSAWRAISRARLRRDMCDRLEAGDRRLEGTNQTACTAAGACGSLRRHFKRWAGF